MFNLISKEKEKMKVINYYHFSTALQMCAVIGTVAAPLTLYSVELGLDPLGRGQQYTAVPIDETYPKYIQENQEKYSHLIKPWN